MPPELADEELERLAGVVSQDQMYAITAEVGDQIAAALRELVAARAEIKAWRAWNDRVPFDPDNGILAIEDARAAYDRARGTA